MQRMTILLSAAAALLLSACSQTTDPSVGEPADAPATTETPLEQAADLPPGTTIKGADGSKIVKQADGDIKVKDADGNKVKRDADDGTVKVK